MRKVKDISEEENARVVEREGISTIKRCSIKPEPEGTIILKAFRIVGYDADCDGSLMARLENINDESECTGWDTNAIGVTGRCSLVVTEQELRELFR